MESLRWTKGKIWGIDEGFIINFGSVILSDFFRFLDTTSFVGHSVSDKNCIEK
jgi:hypothetical protein